MQLGDMPVDIVIDVVLDVDVRVGRGLDVNLDEIVIVVYMYL